MSFDQMMSHANFSLTKPLASLNAVRIEADEVRPINPEETRSFIRLANAEIDKFYTKGAPIKISTSGSSAEMIDIQRLLLQTQEIWQKHFG
ncbi:MULTISPECIES: hypothetical protein [unclassified Pseudovibrio]|uniref:hypothetical protein n=1 Tax=unclassified Pseudovibrio TaxID=2627060 RepID=UPI001AD923E7|nr:MULTISPECIES: hypothetical protein [unclassified Pseudovibrio]